MDDTINIVSKLNFKYAYMNIGNIIRKYNSSVFEIKKNVNLLLLNDISIDEHAKVVQIIQTFLDDKTTAANITLNEFTFIHIIEEILSQLGITSEYYQLIIGEINTIKKLILQLSFYINVIVDLRSYELLH